MTTHAAEVSARDAEAHLDDAGRWAAVVARDRGQDGHFVYAVTTTGIYCRPSCPARRPHLHHVRFLDGPADAERAGFRACKRCRPAGAPSASDQAVARARAYLDARTADIDAAVTLADVARAVGLSPHHLQRVFTRAVGVSPKQYVAALRADRLKAHLRAGHTVSRATFEAGYGAGSRAYDAGAARLGMTPAAYRRGGRGAHIRYATAATTLGQVLVAATARGVCAVTLGDDDAQLEQGLADEYPRATRARVAAHALTHDAALRGWLDAVTLHLEGLACGDPSLGVPIDVGGTPLQRRVWEELRRIPAGETRSYAAVAAAIGVPRAVRAVANACAQNRVALVIPCHRVVRSGGALGGYRWGLERKRALLAREQ